MNTIKFLHIVKIVSIIDFLILMNKNRSAKYNMKKVIFKEVLKTFLWAESYELMQERSPDGEQNRNGGCHPQRSK